MLREFPTRQERTIPKDWKWDTEWSVVSAIRSGTHSQNQTIVLDCLSLLFYFILVLTEDI